MNYLIKTDKFRDFFTFCLIKSLVDVIMWHGTHRSTQNFNGYLTIICDYNVYSIIWSKIKLFGTRVFFHVKSIHNVWENRTYVQVSTVQWCAVIWKFDNIKKLEKKSMYGTRKKNEKSSISTYVNFLDETTLTAVGHNY